MSGRIAKTDDNIIFITGYAKLPGSITAAKMYQVIGIALEVDGETGRILDSDCTLATELGKTFFKKLTVGYCLDDGMEGLFERMDRRYHGSAKKAIITALKSAYEKWKIYQESH